MLRLDTTTRKLQAVLAGAITTNQLPILVSWADKSSTDYAGGSTPTNTNSTTAVDICAAPGASTIRDIDYISVRNADTAAATVTIRYNDNSTTYDICKAALAVGDHLVYVHGSGWQVIDADGNLQTGAAAGGIALSDNNTWTGTNTFRNAAGIRSEQAATQDAIAVVGRAGGTGSYEVTITPTTLTADRTATFPNLSGTVAYQGPVFRAYESGATSITSSYNKVSLAGESFDTDAAFASGKFQPTVAGYYQFNGSVQFATSNYNVSAILYKNGAAYAWGSLFVGVKSVVSDVIYLNGSTDYVELYGYSATTQNTTTGEANTYLSGILIKAA